MAVHAAVPMGPFSRIANLVLISHAKSYAKRPHKPAGNAELEEHEEHTAGPGESLYLPVSHAVHVPPLGPVLTHTHTHTHTHIIIIIIIYKCMYTE